MTAPAEITWTEKEQKNKFGHILQEFDPDQQQTILSS